MTKANTIILAAFACDARFATPKQLASQAKASNGVPLSNLSFDNRHAKSYVSAYFRATRAVHAIGDLRSADRAFGK